MSLDRNGKHIHCDGDGCEAKACVPVVRGDSVGGDECLQAVRGWLFVLNDSITWHYCPRCSGQQLPRLRRSVLEGTG